MLTLSWPSHALAHPTSFSHRTFAKVASERRGGNRARWGCWSTWQALTNQVAFPEEMPFGKGGLWDLGDYQQLRHVGPLETQTPLDRGKVEFHSIFFIVSGCGGSVMVNLCVCRYTNTEEYGCGFITYMHMKVGIFILFTVVVVGTLQSWRFAVVETAVKLLLSFCFHKHVTFWGKKISI